MRLITMGSVSELVRLWYKNERRLQLLVLVSALAVVIGLTVFWLLNVRISSPDYWKTLGYPGVFFLSLIGSGGLVLPVPGLMAVCGAGGLELNFILVGMLSGLGETLGEISGYAVGYGGQAIIGHRRFYYRVKMWMERRGTLVIFLVSLIPNPIFDVVGVAAGGVRFPLLRFLGVALLGKTLKGMIVAHTCFWIAQLVPWV